MNNTELARNLKTLPETLDLLANDKDWLVRRDVAWNPNTPSETLDRLANDEDWRVRYWVAENPNIPQYLKDYFKIKKFLNCYE